MTDKHDYLALDWVRGEIQETLNQAQHALEAFVENPEDTTRIRFCQTYLHQVYGTLQMVEFYGAALLAEEMEQLAQALLEGRVTRLEDAQETLMRAILQLPPYLDRVQASRRDLPVVLLPLLNDMRAARGASLMSETALFKPDIAGGETTGEVPEMVADDPAFPGFARKVRQMYQLALVGIIRGENLEANLGFMAKVFHKMQQVSGDTSVAPLWKVSAALIEGLRLKGLELGASIKVVLGQIDRLLKRIASEGAVALREPAPPELLKNLLYYIAKSSEAGPQITYARKTYRLDSALPSEDEVNAERAALSGPDNAAMSSVVGALCEELNKVKDALEVFVHNQESDGSKLKPEEQTLKQVADTLAMLGLGQPRQLVQQQLEVVNQIATGQLEPSRDVLMDVAGAMLYVEATLQGLSSERRPARDHGGALANVPDHVEKAQEAVMRECRAGLEEAKDGIVEFIASQWKKEYLTEVPDKLTAVRGGLGIIGLSQPAEILRQCARYIAEKLMPEDAGKPDWRTMDTLADAISSVEYYLERLSNDPETSDSVLDVARKSLELLGYSVEGAEAPDSESVTELAANETAVESAPEDEGQSQTDDATLDEESFDLDVAALDGLSETNETLDEGEAFILPDVELTAAAVTESQPVSAPPAVATSRDEDDLIDDEIVEIFVEESNEVLETLDEYFPRWVANQQDQEALVEFRRAFHTLKGSGRMVGAMTVGELAWSIENMMNRVIDNTITPTPILIELVRTVHGIIPALVQAFAQRTADPYDIEPLQAAAFTLAEGGTLDAVPVVGASTSTQPAAEPENISLADGAVVAADESAAEAVAQDSDDDTVLLDIFFTEAESNIEQLEQWVAGCDSDLKHNPLDDSVYRAFHTLKGSARMADVAGVAQLAEPAEAFARTVASQGGQADKAQLALITAVTAALKTGLAKAQGAQVEIPEAEQLVAELQAQQAALMQLEEEGGASLAEFLGSAMDHIDAADDGLSGLGATPDSPEVAARLVAAVGALRAAAAYHQLPEIETLCAALEQCYIALGEGRLKVTGDFIDLASETQETLLTMMDRLAAGQGIQTETRLETSLMALTSGASFGATEEVTDITFEDVDWGADATVTLTDDDLPALENDLDDVSEIEFSADHALTDSVQDIVIEEVSFELPQPGVEEQREESLSFESELPQVDEPSSEESSQGGNDSPFFSELPDPPQPLVTPAPVAESFITATEIDAELLEIFFEEAEEVLEHANNALDEYLDSGNLESLQLLQRHLHTLKGGARMSGISPVGDLSHELESLYEGLVAGIYQYNPELNRLLQKCHDQLASMVEEVRAQGGCTTALALQQSIQAYMAGDTATAFAEPPAAAVPEVPAVVEPAPVTLPEVGQEALTEQPDTVANQDVPVTAPVVVTEALAEASELPPPAATTVPEDRDPELVAIFLEEADEILEAANTSLESWMEAPDNLVEVQSLQRDLHTLKGGARMAEVPELGDLGHEMENLYEGCALGRLKSTPLMFQLLQQSHDRLAEMVEAVKQNKPLVPAQDLIAAIHRYIENPDAFQLDSTPSVSVAATPAAAPQAAPQPVAAANSATPNIVLPADVDPEIFSIFLEESSELAEVLEQRLTAWLAEPDNMEHGHELRRTLHTLKGGARLAGLKELGDISHDFETLLESPALQRAPTAEHFIQLQAWQERIAVILDQIGAAAVAPEPAEPAPTAVVPAAPTAPSQAAKSPGTQQQGPVARRQAQQQPQEMVRIDAGVLESLVNLAGETSINRGRVEQGVNEFAQYVQEMGNTIERLYEQLRRLDAETESQIMSNYQQGLESGQYGEDFDPLEMDQYSELHQITKQLSESASDLMDLKGSLIDRTRDAETLLLQQSRINTELQERLMRTRMVPFSRLVPRLRRIVRQISGEISKKVDFEVINPEGELDRTLMERIVAPLEHMLRNAVDHGVEDPATRVAAGKSETGLITLELTREGGEVVMILSDDGKGIDTQAVRRKAVERGLIDDNAKLSDQEIQQFIFNAGFSTAAKVTQISGRGVGMDVVASEIKQLGGSVSIESKQGQGTRFMVRLPFTLAMNRALMVRVGEDAYAIPLNQIEGIVRISPFEIEKYLGAEATPFMYANQKYELDYLGGYVHGSRPTHLLHQQSPLPVLLIRSTEHSVAILIDGLIGAREVVVKSVGPQLATVAGISGATILGDGSVVIILDVHSLIRAAHLQRQAGLLERQQQPLEELLPPEPEVAEPEQRTPLIMVTDDSVTVRKVTTRLLERNGYEVVTAKDGLDAVAKIEERKPDLMLLDIEMPRMDGFEVASHIRHDSRMRDMAIIMITSRTGEKHRERAMEIGVDRYMGKPYQEAEVLANIEELLKERAQKARDIS